jgi:diguanylate cyclase (GGDEF)-like protein
VKDMLSTDKWISEQDKGKFLLPAWQRLVDLMAELCGTPAGFIVQAGSEEFKIIIANDSVENPYQADVIIDSEVNIFCKEVVKQNACLYVNNATERPDWLSNPEVSEDGFNTYLGYPLHWPDGSIFGTICVMDFLKTDYDDRYNRLLEHFSNMAELELNMLSKTIQFKHSALNDDLTHLFNRKGFFFAAEQLLKSAKRNKTKVCVCYFDIDNLKPINDNFGHQAGDEVIKMFSLYLKQAFREVDVIARFGGDEFVVLFQEKKQLEISKLIRRLSTLVDNNELVPNLSFSYGYSSIASKNMDIKVLENLIKLADDEMYINKSAKK